MLQMKNACEIVDLLHEIADKAGVSYTEAESAMFKLGKYPESTKTFISKDSILEHCAAKKLTWLGIALIEILNEANITDMYITI